MSEVLIIPNIKITNKNGVKKEILFRYFMVYVQINGSIPPKSADAIAKATDIAVYRNFTGNKVLRYAGVGPLKAAITTHDIHTTIV